MEFLYRLYSNNYFGIGLFIVITILAFSFLVILFFGKKDEKARAIEKEKQEEQKKEESLVKEELSKEEKLQTESLETIELPNEQPINLEPKEKTPEFEEDILDLSNPNLNTWEEKENITPIMEDQSIEKEILTPLEETYKPEEISLENDFTGNIYNLNNLSDVKEEMYDDYHEEERITRENRQTREAPIYNEENSTYNAQDNIYYEPITEIEEPTRKPMPEVFSSVYKNNERDLFTSNENLEENEPISTEVQPQEERKPIPVKPEFELPKKIDLPKLNKNTDNNDSIIKF